MDFILIFQVFFQIYFLTENAKRVYLFVWDPQSWRGAAGTHGGATRGHVDVSVDSISNQKDYES